MSEMNDILKNLADEEDPSSRLECLLAALAEQCDLQDTSPATSPKELSPEIHEMAKLLSGRILTGSDSALNPVWKEAIIHITDTILPHLSPLELHASVLQSIFWSPEETENGIYPQFCLLLCTYAMRSCPEPLEKRKKRWHSVLWESLRVFQRYPNRTLWSFHMFPALIHVQHQVKDGTIANQMAFMAAMISTTTYLAYDLVQHAPNQHDLSSGLDQLLQTLTQDLVPISDLIVSLCLHPWRKRSPLSNDLEGASPEALLAYYTASDDAFATENALEERQEAIFFVQTDWASVGLALLIERLWHQRPNGVWTLNYQWQLWFPQVSSLLNAQTPANEEVESRPIVTCRVLGYDLLSNLVQFMLPGSLQLPKRQTDPLSPIGTFQLLSNLILDSSKSTNSIGLPPAGRTYQLMKDLLSVYTPLSQYQLVEKLVQTCPHPGMQPKILDLWRPFAMAWNHDPSAQQAVLDFLYQKVIKTLEEQHLDASSDLLTVKDVPGLIASSEFYAAGIGLIQLWIRIKGPLDRIKSGLVNMRAALENSFQLWESTEPPEDSFRLQLLHDTVVWTLKLIG